MFSIVSLSALGLLNNLSQSFRQEINPDFYGVVNEIKDDPGLYKTRQAIELISREKLEDGSEWVVYRYSNPETNQSFQFPIFRESD